MSVFANKPFSRLWPKRSKSVAHIHPPDFVGGTAPPFVELTSGSETVPVAEELAKVRYYYSRMAVRDADFVVSRAFIPPLCRRFRIPGDGMIADVRVALRIWI